MAYLFIFLIGLAFGSFASVIIHRLHTQEKGIFTGRSKCPSCQNTLAAIDLIPVLSYIMNKFKCRFCKEPISLRYPILELSMGLLFALTTYLVGFSNIETLVFYLIISFVFVVLVFYDFLFQEVPDQVSLPAIVLAIAFALKNGSMTGASLAIGLIIPILFFGLLFFGSGGRWLGGGDIRIGALMGALLGYPFILTALFIGYLSGSIYSLVGLGIKKFDRRTQIPFAPFLLLGAYLTMFWGQEMMDWYLNLI